MTTQNLVSEVFTDEGKTAVTQGLAGIKGGLPPMVPLEPEEKNELVKVGKSYLPLLELANEVALSHPEILSGVFDVEEFKKDYKLATDLTPYLNEMKELVESVENTTFAAYSDAMAGALEIYAAVRQHKDKVPGLNAISVQMSAFFTDEIGGKTLLDPPENHLAPRAAFGRSGASF